MTKKASRKLLPDLLRVEVASRAVFYSIIIRDAQITSVSSGSAKWFNK